MDVHGVDRRSTADPADSIQIIRSKETRGNSRQLPQLPNEYLRVIFIESNDDEDRASEDLPRALPLADSRLFVVDRSRVSSSARRLSHGDDVKEAYSIELPSNDVAFEPGDTIAIIPHNTDEELDRLFDHLRITHLTRKKCKIVPDGNVKFKSKPIFLDRVVTLRQLFKDHIDIRCLPKKTLIRVMAEHTASNKERETLEELCSREGSDKYESQILETNVTFVDLLTSLKTCRPPVERLLENLPPLLPRPYSIASSPLASRDSFKIVFSVASVERDGRTREGLCTGMLKSIIEERDDGKCSDDAVIEMFFRKSHGFRLPPNCNHPLILIASGTGIAPYIGFLQHWKMQKMQRGAVWLFYGCRYKSRDYLFESELSDYLDDGTLTKLSVSHSREPDCDAKYVQDNIRKFGKEVCNMLCEENAIAYVCGEARGMRKDVLSAFVDILQRHRGLSLKEASNFVKVLEKEKRYRQDVWLY